MGSKMKRMTRIGWLLLAIAPALPAAEDTPLLLQSPTLSRTQIAFAYGDDIWVAGREGGDAQRLVAGGGINSGPIFSPDGSLVAYTGNVDGNTDVYVVSSSGGEPRRLTYQPGSDVALAWTPDGKSILFRSSGQSNSTRYERLFTVRVEGGFPAEVPLPMGVQGAYSPDGSHLAYVPHWNRRLGTVDSYIAIKRYRGGLAAPIWIADLSDSSVVQIPRDGSNDTNPMWVGEKIYFLSDRNGPTTLFSYDTKSREVKELLKNDGFDMKSAAAGPGAIVYAQPGSIHLYDPTTGQTRALHFHVAGDMPQLRARFERVPPAEIVTAGISPTGARAVLEARGDIFTVPAKNGDVRNITHSPGVAERDPAWSPDGKSIAYFSDESGEYALHISDQSGVGKVRVVGLGDPPSFFYRPTWSPDSKKIAYSDKRLNLWYVDLDHPTPVKVDTDRFDEAEFDVNWSPDSRWLAYTKRLESRLHAIFVYSLEKARARQLTDGMSDATLPRFDKNGKQLYFAASTDSGVVASGLDMTSDGRRVTRNVYLAVLRKDLPSPLAPQSDDEKGDKAADAKDAKSDEPADAKPAETVAIRIGEAVDKPAEAAVPAKDAASDPKKGPASAKKKEPPKVEIDLENIGQRILSVPIPAVDILDLQAGKEEVLHVVSADPAASPGPGPRTTIVQRFEFKTRKTEKLLDGVTRFALSADGEKMLYAQENKAFIVPADKAPKPGDGALKLEAMEAYIDPKAEWRQIYHEVWRIERDFFYDPHFHGLDLAAAERTYAQFLDGVASRTDLNYLFGDMLGNLNVLHMYVGGGLHPRAETVHVGLLGANYALDHDRYRFARVFDGENWNPELHAPLTQPGVNVKEGEYLLEVNGRPLRAADDLYRAFEETAGRQTVLKVGSNPDGTASRDVTVVPLESEAAIRHLAWIEDNRRTVDKLSGGRLGYVYLPDTGEGGFASFNRYFFAQVGKEGLVVDERFNSGGQLADYIIDHLRRPLMNFVTTREGEVQASPGEAIFGPKAMIINEFAGSGGDAMPWYFRKAQIGPLIGERTWGGLVGIGGYPVLIDGGTVTSPRMAIYGLAGQWEVENHGIAPDIEVELDPKLVRQGHDPQLEKAVEVVLGMLKDHPLPAYAKPPYPDYHPRLPESP
jgi:tricorn protease